MLVQDRGWPAIQRMMDRMIRIEAQPFFSSDLYAQFFPSNLEFTGP